MPNLKPYPPTCWNAGLPNPEPCPADPIRGLPGSWSTKIRTGGLATILMRAGLKIDKNAFKRAGRVVLSLALVPVICEAVVDGFCFYWCSAIPPCIHAWQPAPAWFSVPRW